MLSTDEEDKTFSTLSNCAFKLLFASLSLTPPQPISINEDITQIVDKIIFFIFPPIKLVCFKR